MVKKRSETTSELAEPPEIHDAIPTSKRDVIGWLGYSVAMEPVSFIAIDLYLPVILQNLTRRVGHLANDPSRPCPLETSQSNDGFSTSIGCVVNPIPGLNIDVSAFFSLRHCDQRLYSSICVYLHGCCC